MENRKINGSEDAEIQRYFNEGCPNYQTLSSDIHPLVPELSKCKPYLYHAPNTRIGLDGRILRWIPYLFSLILSVPFVLFVVLPYQYFTGKCFFDYPGNGVDCSD